MATAERPIVPTGGTECPLPSGAELGPVDATFREDPYSVLKLLRGAAPVYWDAAFERWFITGFDEVRAVLRNKDMSSDPFTAARLLLGEACRWLQAGFYGELPGSDALEG